MKSLVITLALLTAAPCFAGPCKEKHQALRVSRKAMKECTKAWYDSMRGDQPDPTDDCSAANTALVTSIREVKVCVREAKAKKSEGTKE